MPENQRMTTRGTVLPIIPPPMPQIQSIVVPPREATRPAGLPTRVWKDTRGYHRNPTPRHKQK